MEPLKVSRSPRILGIETSTLHCEIALAEGEFPVASTTLPAGLKPTASLVPAIRDLCRSAGLNPRELELICVDQGPGSYTGLRVGVTCAKTLAFAAGSALATAGSLEVVAQNAPAGENLVEVAFDAARGQVFTCRFRRLSNTWVAEHEVRIESASDWARTLAPNSLVIGPALSKYRELVPDHHRVADESLWWPRADWVVRIGHRQHLVAPRVEYFSLEPVYLRPSAAEEKRGIGTGA